MNIREELKSHLEKNPDLKKVSPYSEINEYPYDLKDLLDISEIKGIYEQLLRIGRTKEVVYRCRYLLEYRQSKFSREQMSEAVCAEELFIVKFYTLFNSSEAYKSIPNTVVNKKEEYKELLNKIKGVRNKIIAHLDRHDNYMTDVWVSNDRKRLFNPYLYGTGLSNSDIEVLKDILEEISMLLDAEFKDFEAKVVRKFASK